MDFTDLQDNLKTVEHQVNEIQAMKEGLSNEQAKLYNEFVKMVARQITNVTMTCADKYSQDSYGYTSLSYPSRWLRTLSAWSSWIPLLWSMGLSRHSL